MALVKIKEMIAVSPNSFEDALQEAVKKISEQKENVSGAKIVGWTVDIKDGQISEYKVNLRYAYRWEEKLHQ